MNMPWEGGGGEESRAWIDKKISCSYIYAKINQNAKTSRFNKKAKGKNEIRLAVLMLRDSMLTILIASLCKRNLSAFNFA